MIAFPGEHEGAKRAVPNDGAGRNGQSKNIVRTSSDIHQGDLAFRSVDIRGDDGGRQSCQNLGSLLTFAFHFSSPRTFSLVSVLSSDAHPVRCGSCANIGQSAANSETELQNKVTITCSTKRPHKVALILRTLLSVVGLKDRRITHESLSRSVLPIKPPLLSTIA